jgi:hypothetical protein
MAIPGKDSLSLGCCEAEGFISIVGALFFDDLRLELPTEADVVTTVMGGISDRSRLFISYFALVTVVTIR